MVALFYPFCPLARFFSLSHSLSGCIVLVPFTAFFYVWVCTFALSCAHARQDRKRNTQGWKKRGWQNTNGEKKIKSQLGLSDSVN